MSADDIFLFLVGVMIGIVMMTMVVSFTIGENITLNQETADDICHNLTGKYSSVASDSAEGKLICEVPSFDSTTNIIVKPSGAEE